MITEQIKLSEENEGVYMQAYILHNSRQFGTDRLRPAVIVCPGGGYQHTSDREAEPVALRFLAQGFHVFVLRYSVGPSALFPQPFLDTARAIAMVRDRAGEWLVDPEQIAVCGFSAGGHVAAASGVFWSKPFIYETLQEEPMKLKPNALILAYPVIHFNDWPRSAVFTEDKGLSEAERAFTNIFGTPHPGKELREQYGLHLHVNASVPPSFLWHTADDSVVSVRNSLDFAAALTEHQVPYELHVFPQGVHGLSLADQTTATHPEQVNERCQIWINLATAWLKGLYS
ncbi:alpha/beta hydrolase [Paenibacillus sp. P96]|uniref:Alpha/beta hydrolase n=1 Tax=Paenibacillus zeirhizosphaerae TaxID=2987519 RepID=A0ABT9FTB9_9BACL|nr:alpha/beta hydrolase [Paenibacillus sp. P96]MDP4097987.1 alpha/beta hydrolase [Paenibacillus sp. P96]